MPTVLRTISGNRGKKRLNRSEPMHDALDPAAMPPEWIADDPGARAEWQRCAPHLVRLGLLSVVDCATFGGYCWAYSHFVEAQREIKQHGTVLILRDDKGAVTATTASPYVAIAIKMLDKIRQFAAEFGFTPSSRGRLELARIGAEPVDDLVGGLDLEELKKLLEGEKRGGRQKIQ